MNINFGNYIFGLSSEQVLQQGRKGGEERIWECRCWQDVLQGNLIILGVEWHPTVCPINFLSLYSSRDCTLTAILLKDVDYSFYDLCGVWQAVFSLFSSSLHSTYFNIHVCVCGGEGQGLGLVVVRFHPYANELCQIVICRKNRRIYKIIRYKYCSSQTSKPGEFVDLILHQNLKQN